MNKLKKAAVRGNFIKFFKHKLKQSLRKTYKIYYEVNHKKLLYVDLNDQHLVYKPK